MPLREKKTADPGTAVDCRGTPAPGGYSLMEMLIVISIIGVLATFAIPRLLSTKTVANEGAALTVVRGLVTSQATYSLTAGFGKYATDLSQLEAAKMVDAVVASGTKQGYTFALAGDGYTFTVNADPVTFGSSGSRSFYTDATGVIRFTSEDRPATAADPPVQ